MARHSKEIDNIGSKRILKFISIVVLNAIDINVFMLLFSGMKIFWKIIEDSFLRSLVTSIVFVILICIFFAINSRIGNKIIRDMGTKYWYSAVIIGGILGIIFFMSFISQFTNNW